MALSVKPHLTQIWALLGQMRHQDDNISGALDALNQACKLEPLNPKYLNDFARLLLKCNKPKEAIPVLEEIARLKPEDPDSWQNLGTALQGAKREHDAKTAYEKSFGH
jgi:cytochrome c-type biogenesis protein CcmH/NrfG